MAKNLNKQLAKWAAEILVITLGITLAISAESLWQERNDRREEVRYLKALVDDFDASLELLDVKVGIQNESTEALLFLLQGKAATTEPGHVRAWIRDGLYNASFYEPQLNALKDLEQSGKMDLLQDAKLRRELAALLQMVGHFEVFLSSYVRSQENMIDPYLVSHFDLALALNIGGVSVGDQSAPLEFDPSIFEELDMRSRIALKLSLRRAMQRHQSELRTQFEALLVMIQSQLSSQRPE